ncbi:MAG: PRC-barrel domain-containing protein, partial [Dehalococcoidia bacterium]
MLREASALLGQAIDACDGRLGTIEDLYFDDQDWRVRYVVVQVGLPFRRSYVLIEPADIQQSDCTVPRLHVWLTRAEARERTAASSQLTVGEQRRDLQHGASLSRRVGAQLGIQPDDRQLLEEAQRVMAADPHLRSVRSVRAYRLCAREGAAGRVRDFVVDDGTWAVCHIEAEVELFIGKKPVLVLPQSIEAVDFDARTVRVGLSRHALGGA